MNKDIYYNGIGITNQVWFSKAAKGKIFYEQDDVGKIDVYFSFLKKESPSEGGRFIYVSDILKFIIKAGMIVFSSYNKKVVDIFTKACKDVLKEVCEEENEDDIIDSGYIFNLLYKYYKDNNRNIFDITNSYIVS